jgi:hypothetical protein
MVVYTVARLPLVGLFAAIVLLLMLISRTDPLWQNWVHVRSLHQLTSCAGASFLANTAYRIWAGALDQPPACMPMIAPGADPAFVAFAAWLNGGPAETEVILRIQPDEQREVFAWRNRSQASLPGAYAAPESPAAAQFVAHLSVEAWRLGQRPRAITLAQTVMTELTPEVADILASGIAPRRPEEFLQFAYVREQIGRQLPDRVINYEEWFEAAIHYQQWDSAGKACERLRLYAHNRSKDLSLYYVCQARLSYYQADYAAAFNELRELSQIRPTDPVIWTWLGLSAKQLEKYVDAENAFQQAIVHQADPESFLNLYWQLGDCQRALGKNEQARYSYRMALRYDRNERYHSTLERLLEQVQ